MLKDKEKELLGLIKEFKSGSDKAFDEIGRLIAVEIVNIAYSYIGNRSDAKDVCQNVLIKIYKKLDSFKGKASFSTWVYRITINACIDLSRKTKRIFSLDETKIINREENFSVIESMESKEKRIEVRKSLDRLSLKQRNVVVLKHFKGLKIREISKILQCSESSVKTHLFRAIANLKKQLQLGGSL